MGGRQPGSAHKDCDARRSMKNNAACHGHGSHTLVNAGYKYIRKGVAADAGVHGGKVPARPLPKDGRERAGLIAGSACRSAETGAELRGRRTVSGICGRGCGGHHPAERHKRGNGRRPKRARTGHAYGSRKMGGQRYFFTAWGLPAPKYTPGQ